MSAANKPLRDPLNRAFYLPRLPREYYQGDAVVHWTLTIFDRAEGWLTPSFHSQFRELMLHAAAREGLVCPVYCLMPDHLHLLWMGLRLDTDHLNGMAFLRTYLDRHWPRPRFNRRRRNMCCAQSSANATPSPKCVSTSPPIRCGRD